jgi:hypothetical protein
VVGAGEVDVGTEVTVEPVGSMLNGSDARVMGETVVGEDGGATEERDRLGLCPGNERTGISIPKLAH